ncbi:MAG: GNAT family N-acetyltransferase, partial [Chloroflexi bacterium]|nr:GNAT family N-acetyltransferase [Chloroflexota bacterium]
MTLVRSLAEADRPAAGEILRLAFADKMPRAFGPDPVLGAAVLADIVTPCANAFVGDADGRVVGVLLLEEHGGPPASAGASTYVVSWRALRRHLSIPAAVRAWLVLALFGAGSYPRDRLCIDTVAVHPDYQGRGVAGALLRFAIAEGRRRGVTAVCLYVIDRNAHARAVYEHLGFRVIYTQRLGLLAP